MIPHRKVAGEVCHAIRRPLSPWSRRRPPCRDRRIGLRGDVGAASDAIFWCPWRCGLFQNLMKLVVARSKSVPISGGCLSSNHKHPLSLPSCSQLDRSPSAASFHCTCLMLASNGRDVLGIWTNRELMTI